MRQRLVTATLVQLLALAVSGCFPMVTRYTQLDGPGVELRSSLCPTIGPPGRAAIKDGDVTIEVSLNPGAQADRGSLSLYGPLDARLALISESLRVVEADTGKTYTMTLAPQARRPLPPGVKEPPQTRQSQHYGFPLPADLPEHGTLILPEIRIEDKVLASRSLQFTRKTWVGTMPLNC